MFDPILNFLIQLHILALDLAGLIAGDLSLRSIGRQDARCDWIDLSRINFQPIKSREKLTLTFSGLADDAFDVWRDLFVSLPT